MRHSGRKISLIVVASCVFALTGSADLFGQARSVFLDFNDPDDPILNEIDFDGDAEVIEDGGVDNTGYLKVTNAENGQRGFIRLPDLSDPPGTALASFQIQADLRVGGGTGGGDPAGSSPADGFSFNLVRPTDPLLEDPPGSYAASPANENNLPEEGSQTGLAIGFDEWQSGPADANATATDCGSVAFDCVGMSIRIDNELVFQAPFPTRNGELTDTTSLQTGPLSEFNDPIDRLEALSFAQLKIQVTPDLSTPGNSNILINYKDREVFNDSVAYEPTPGQLVFGGRTGGANSNHHIDNIRVTTDFTEQEPLGDFNMDGVLDTADFNILAENMNSSPAGDLLEVYEKGDIDFSSSVNIRDFAVFRQEFLAQGAGGAAAAVPEPASALLAVFGLLGLTAASRRRRM